MPRHAGPLTIATLLLVPLALGAQGRLRLFLDCHLHCDGQFLRTEVTLVDWVSDRTAADVHVIASDLSTGAGGQQVTLEYIGLGPLASLRDTVRFTTPPDASEDDFREELGRMLRLGLVRYLVAAGKAGDVVLAAREDRGPPEPALPADDPWSHWIFTVGLDAELDAESREVGYQVGGDLEASHVTEDWKIELHIGGDLDRTRFTLDDGDEFTARRDRWSGSGLAVRSLGPHWSLGVTGSLRGSKPDNLDLRARIAPALEWDLFPYAEASRRQLIVIYSLGVTRYDYVDETIYDQLQETRVDHALQLAYESRQPWGTARVSGTAATFLHDWSRNRLSVFGGLEVRLARGLAFEVDGSYARVRDQITLRKGDASDEEVFLRLRELATDYRASLNVGLSYTFGSFFNSIVNPRFDEVD